MFSSCSKKRLLLVLTAPIFLTIVVCFLPVVGIRIPCIFHEITGLQCPGCGNTRAALSLLRFDLKAAFSYNLLFLPQFLYLAFVYFRASADYVKGNKFSYHTPWPPLDYIALIMFLAWGIIRNII